MKKTELKDTLIQKPTFLMVNCKENKRKGERGCNLDLRFEYGRDEKYNFSDEEIQTMLALAKTNTLEFLQILIDKGLNNELITEYYQGDNYLLPARFRRFHDKCVLVESKDYSIAFTDMAIRKCSSLIYHLSEKSKQDSLTFVKGKLENQEASHLYLSISDLSFQKGRFAGFDKNEEKYALNPKNTAYYTTYMGKRKKVAEDDIKNILILIEEFAKTYGYFDYIKFSEEELVAYNKNSLKISGINYDERLFQKVYELRK